MSQKLRVMVVDDQAIILEAVRQMLAGPDEFELCLEQDPSAAIDRALEFGPHVVLLDINMEPIDGLEVLTQFRSHPELTDMSIVMLSTAEEPTIKVECFRRGANDYVVKLPSALELLARARYHARAFLAAREREAAYQALVESRAALAQRNIEVEHQKAQLELMNQELADSAVTDALTALRNRRYLRVYLEQKVEPALAEMAADAERRHPAGPGLSFFLFDLDHFKQINDQYGHDAGDAVLVEVARRLRLTLRAGDALIRWGGEEFLIACRGHDQSGACRLASRMLHAIGSQPIPEPGGRPLRVTCSLGFAQFPWSRDPALEGSLMTYSQVINLADLGVYLSKHDGRNRAFGIFPGPAAERMIELRGAGLSPAALRAENGSAVTLHPLAGP